MNKSKWYHWILISLCWVVGGIVNYFDDRQTIAPVIQVCIAIALGFIQFFCERKGETGKKAFKYISIVTLILLMISLICLVIYALG